MTYGQHHGAMFVNKFARNKISEDFRKLCNNGKRSWLYKLKCACLSDMYRRYCQEYSGSSAMNDNSTATPAELSNKTSEQGSDVSSESKTNKTYKSSVVVIPPDDCWDQIQTIRKDHDKTYERWMPHINLLYPFLEDVDEGRVFQDAASRLQLAVRQLKPFRVRMSPESFHFFRQKKYCTLWLKPEVVPTEGGLQHTGVEERTLSPSVHAQPVAAAQSEPDENVGGETDKTAHVNTRVAETSGIHAGQKSNPDTSMLSKKQQRKLDKANRKQDAQAKELEALGESHPEILVLQHTLEREFPECTDVSTISERGFTPHLSLGQFSPREVELFKDRFQKDWQTIEFLVDRVCLISRADFHDPFHVRQNVILGK